MSGLRVFLSRVLDVLLRRPREARLDEEIRTHLDLLTDDFVARGLSHREAELAARRAFGGVDQVKAVHRDQRGLPIVDAVTQDVVFALRLLRRDRGFSLTVVLVLALGIGVNNMLFTMLNAHTLRGLPIRHAERVLSLATIDDHGQDGGVSFADFTDLRAAARSFEGLLAFSSAPVIVAGSGRAPERLDGIFISGDPFTISGGQPVLGRTFTAADQGAGAAAVAIVGSGAWQSHYGGDPAIVGRQIIVNGAPATVIGVMPARSGFPSTAEIWLPLAQLPGLDAQTRGDRSLDVLGRVRDGVAVDDAGWEVRTVADRLAVDHPDTNRNVRARILTINERYFGSWRQPVWFAFIMAGFLVLAISAANVANLMLARAVRRTREIAIRTSLGASRLRIVRQLLIEGSVLAACGGTVGLGVAVAGVRLFRSAIPAGALPYWLDYSVDWRVVAALVSVSIGTVFVFALLPAIQASKTDVQGVLKDEGVTTPARRGARRWTTAFLTAELALAVVLIAQVVLSLLHARPDLPTERAIDTGQVLTAAVTLPPDRYRTPQQRTEFYRQVAERLRAQPEVASVSVVSLPPLMGAPERRLTIAGRRPADPPEIVRTVAIGPRYFETLDLALVRGRGLTDEDASPAHVIVNEKFVSEFFPDAEPVGRQIALDTPGSPAGPLTWVTIAGVAPDIRQRPRPEPEPIVYVAFAGNSTATATLLVRSRTGPAASLGAMLRDEVAALDGNLPLYRMRTLADVVRDAGWNARLSQTLILTLTLIAVGLSTVGMYAVTTHIVSQQTREIGVRMALGARPGQVARLILRRALIQMALGFFGGVVCTRLWGAAFASGSGRAGVTISDLQAIAAVIAALAVIALIATVVPIRRATRLDPVQAIRHGSS